MLQREGQAPYSLTQVCKALGVTARAIRHYEQCGLFTCSRDRQRRTFGPETVRQLHLIIQLRRADLSIRQIRQLLEIGQGAKRHALMVEMIQARIEALDAERSRLSEILEDLRAGPPAMFAISD
jgi:DNA-binding transcriptional MerR regulator